MWIVTKKGSRLKVTDLRDSRGTCAKLQMLLRGHRDVRHTQHVSVARPQTCVLFYHRR